MGRRNNRILTPNININPRWPILAPFARVGPAFRFGWCYPLLCGEVSSVRHHFALADKVMPTGLSILPLLGRSTPHRQNPKKAAQLNTTKNQKNAKGAPSLRLLQGWVLLLALVSDPRFYFVSV
jgi:hypothetical protein